ncbi:MAG: MFS transporter [Rhodospirillaceae bacterium]|jgi:MFS family permease|nr:MFS transporter [Rhodospirillaceae bacterium]MBT5245192.1 MFS transporter [Rhodospirillaceae bacterium]MBT5561918.1 MFS transporter [Rhodospirillaceae bacterium]MBT6241964.1 MFS transporter [Rhodospirillaceae bacterium]MBT7138582.1 MFS transporter [Rhodospirillaceae bacterium]
MSIIAFLSISPRFLAFGFFTAFASSFGQTFFIALSSADIRAEFDLSHGDFGLIYSCATITSAGLLIWAGRKIDDIDLRPYTCIACIGLALACLGMASVGSALWLIPAIFGLRFTGQGLLTHVSAVSMARYFDSHRGKALSVAAMGYPVGEALFPTLAVAVIATLGWRQMWLALGVVLLVLLAPFMLWLLKGHSERHRGLDIGVRSADQAVKITGWTRAQVLKDRRFYVLLPSYLALSFIGTGFFFHQVHLTQSKGWSLSLFVSFFVVYAITQIFSALLSGLLVDRFNARSLMQVYLLPAAVGLGFIATFDAPWCGAVFMAFMGLSSGAVGVTHGAIWAEIYGIAHLGAIKALGAALMVLSTALSPPVMGLALDAGISMEEIALACIAFILFSAALVTFVFPRIYVHPA